MKSTITKIVGYVLLYSIVASLSFGICFAFSRAIALMIEPCSSFGCMIHSMLTLMFSFLLGGLVIPTIVCVVAWDRQRERKKQKRSV